MSTCSSNTLVIGRPSMPGQNCAGINANVASSVSANGCGTGTGCGYFGSNDRKLSKRKYRGKTISQIQDYVMLTLGAPNIKIELNQQNLDIAVEEVMQVFEEYAPMEFFDYYTFDTISGKSVYKMPDDVGAIREVVYKKQASFAFQASDLGGSIPVEYFYPGGAYSSIQGGLIDPIQPIWGRMGEWVQYKQYEQMYSRVSSNIGGWEFVNDLGYIKLYPIPCKCSRVSVKYIQKCKDWKEALQVLREGALARVMIMLGHVRGKYTQIPGPSGGTQIDGDYMRTKGWELWERWKEELLTRFGDLLPISMD